MKLVAKLILPALVLALLVTAPRVAEAQNCNRNPNHPNCPIAPEEPDPVDSEPVDPAPETNPFAWMHPDVFIERGTDSVPGFDGTGSHMVTVDNFSGSTYIGNLDGTQKSLTHGAWTSLQSHLVAPGASRISLDHNGDSARVISGSYAATTGVNVVNLSFGLFDPAGTNVNDPNYSLGNALWDSLVDEAWAGTAVFVKAAGNTNGGTVDGTVTMRLPRPTQMQDVLNLQLIGAPGAIFVGALDGNGTVTNKASIASYSTIAGNTAGVAEMFLVVGVRDDLTGLAGTSFAAPIVSGYAAIIGDKFDGGTYPKAAPGLIVDRLLQTAREDTIAGYQLSIHGQGEACLACALAPDFIPN